MEYKHDIFYDIERLSYEKILELLKEAMDKSYYMVVDEIKWPEGQRQVQHDADPYKWLTTNAHISTIYRFIHRMNSLSDGKPWLQIVIRENDKFLWINLKEDKLEHFVKKYNLKEI